MPKSLLEAKGCSAIPFPPFTENDRIDVDVLEKQIDWICSTGVTSIATPMMVSEFMALSEEERKLMMRIPTEVTDGRIAVIANVAAMSTALAVEYTEYAEKIGADAVITMVPWAGSLDFPGAVSYFTEIAKATSLPVIIQNTQLSSGFSVKLDDIVALCEMFPNVSWVKQEVPPAPVTLEQLHMKMKQTDAIEGLISGFGSFYAPYDIAAGANATISSCQFCDLIQRVWDLFFEGREEEARALHNKMLPALQAESLYGWKYGKEILVRRGILKNSICRNLGGELSPVAKKEIDYLYHLMEPLFLV